MFEICSWHNALGQLYLHDNIKETIILKLMIIPAVLLASLLAACGGSTALQGGGAGATQPAAPVTAAAAPSLATAAAAPTTLAAGATNPTGLATAAATPAPAVTPAAQGSVAPPTGALRTFRIVPEQTEASYEVQEQFLDRNLPNKAIGKTSAVEGEFQFTAAGKPTGQVTKITVDLRTLTSDSGMRDRRIRSQWLESNTYPYATFVSTGVEGVPDSYTMGQQVSFKLLGNMTIHDVTRPITFEMTGKLDGDTVTGKATTQILMKDFGFDPPSVAGILTVQDGVTITVNFTAKAAA
jgi:polyisoprenoid-binding protein YceI